MRNPAGQVEEATKVVRRTMKRAVRGAGGEDAAVRKTRRRLLEAGPDAATLLHHAIRCDTGFAAPYTRVRAAEKVLDYIVRLVCAETALLGEPDAADGDDANGEAH